MATIIYQRRIPVHGNGQMQLGSASVLDKITNMELILVSNVTNDDTIKTLMPEVAYAFATEYKLDTAPGGDNIVSVSNTHTSTLTLRDPTDTTTLISIWVFGRGDSA